MIIPFSDNHERVYWEERSAFPHLRMKRSQGKIQTLGKKWKMRRRIWGPHIVKWDLSKCISDAKSLSCSERTLTRGLCNGCSEWEWVRVFREKVEERSLQRGLWDLLSKYVATELFEEIFAMGALGPQARTTSGRFLSQLYIKESKYKTWKIIL